ncbi:MAG: hypothetical protein Q4E33_05215 [Erysipelotrichaceae bacterium]|nr:hypothetical protein [Erysipelotrichaceae bacterium]
MAKTQDELNKLKQECIQLTGKIKELTEEDLKQIAGGEGEGEALTELGRFLALVLGGGAWKCEDCGAEVSAQYVRNHFIYQHGLSEEEAMEKVPESLRSIQSKD